MQHSLLGAGAGGGGEAAVLCCLEGAGAALRGAAENTQTKASQGSHGCSDGSYTVAREAMRMNTQKNQAYFDCVGGLTCSSARHCEGVCWMWLLVYGRLRCYRGRLAGRECVQMRWRDFCKYWCAWDTLHLLVDSMYEPSCASWLS